MRLFYLPLLLLLLTSLEVSAKRKRPAPRLDRPTNSAKVKPRRPSRLRYTKPSRRNRVKPRTRIVKPKPVVKPKVMKPSPKMKYHNLRYLWLNEVLGNTKRRTIRKKLKLKKKRRQR